MQSLCACPASGDSIHNNDQEDHVSMGPRGEDSKHFPPSPFALSGRAMCIAIELLNGSGQGA